MSTINDNLIRKINSTRGMTVYEPVEVRLYNARLGDAVWVASGWRTDHGTVSYSLTIGGAGIPQSMTNLQPKVAIMPNKAVVGWQAEFVAYVGSGLYEVIEVR